MAYFRDNPGTILQQMTGTLAILFPEHARSQVKGGHPNLRTGMLGDRDWDISHSKVDERTGDEC